MNAKVLLILYLLSCLLHSEAFISINIDPEDFDQVSDFLHNLIVQTHPATTTTTSRRLIIPVIKEATFGAIQLFGVMMTLVGANVISTFLTPAVVVPPTD